MCNPALIAVGIGAGQGLMQGLANKAQADAQAKALRQNAVYLGNAAADARVRGARSADQVRIQGQQLIGTQRAAQAASGGVVDEGSNALIQQDTAQFAELDALTISNNAAREAYGYEVQQVEALQTAKNLRKQGRRGVLTSLIGGALQGGAGAYSAGLFGGGSAAGAGTSAALSGGTSRLNYNQAYS